MAILIVTCTLVCETPFKCEIHSIEHLFRNQNADRQPAGSELSVPEPFGRIDDAQLAALGPEDNRDLIGQQAEGIEGEVEQRFAVANNQFLGKGGPVSDEAQPAERPLEKLRERA